MTLSYSEPNTREKRRVSRRQFLTILATTGLAGAGLSAGLLSRHSVVVTETRVLMGTIVNLSIAGSDRNTAQKAIAATLGKMAELEKVASRFDPNSELSILNRVRYVNSASPALITLLRQSQEVSALSGGAFDVTVQPLVDLYRRTQGEPQDYELEEARSLVDYKQLQVDGLSVKLTRPGMRVSLDSIAKGYIVDQGVDVLKQLGFENVLVEAGGDLMALGEKAPETDWLVGLQAPRAGGAALLAQVGIQNQAVATSGDYMQPFTADFRQHHIMDPRTGASPLELSSVSVMAGTACLADALSTTVMVLGREHGLQLIEDVRGAEAMLITKDGELLSSSGFPNM